MSHKKIKSLASYKEGYRSAKSDQLIGFRLISFAPYKRQRDLTAYWYGYRQVVKKYLKHS